MSDGGKGSSPRPYSIPKEQYDKNWEAIFGKKKNPRKCSGSTRDSKPLGRGSIPWRGAKR
jgi:hypothetical protein